MKERSVSLPAQIDTDKLRNPAGAVPTIISRIFFYKSFINNENYS